MKKLLIIISLLLIIAQGFAQENSNTEEVTIEEAQTESKGLMKELFMFKMAIDVLETRQLISDNELGDSVEKYMTDYDNALFFKSTLDYDFFWNSVLGRKKYKVPSSKVFLDSKEKYLENNEVGTSIDFDIVLKPNWEDPDKEDKLKDYSVKITSGNYTNLSFSDDEEENFNTILNSPFATNVTTPKDAKVNEAVFDGLAALRNKLDRSDAVPEINMTVNFKQYNQQLFGFDKLIYDVHKPTYQQLKINGKDQYLPWKSISSSGTDKILVKFSDYDETITPNEIKYKTSSGINLTATKFEGKDDVHLLSLTGKSNEVVEEIIAYVKYKNSSGTEKDLKVGSLNTITYDKLKINLVIVPVNVAAGFSADVFTQKLNEIYKQSVVEWNVTLDEVYNINESEWDDDGDHAMNDGESTFLSNYSDEQKNFKSQYKKDRDIDKNSYYVFLLNNIPSKSGLKGYMPLKEQYAFIHSANSTNAAQLIAHELGHGAFRLWHTFSSESSFFMAKNSSNNLMDYKDSTRLHKYQWDKVHNPDGGFYMFQDEDEGAAYELRGIVDAKKDLEVKSGGVTFLSPAGIPIHFTNAEELTEIYVTTTSVREEQNIEINEKVINYISADEGVLVAFEYYGEFFIPMFEIDEEYEGNDLKTAKSIFLGYNSAGYYYDQTTKEKTENGETNFKVYQYKDKKWSNPIDICYNYKKYHNGYFYNKDGYQGAGYFARYFERRLSYACSDYANRLKELDDLDFLNDPLYAKYNPYGQGGLIQKIRDRDGDIRIIYSWINKSGITEYLEYDYVFEDWLVRELGDVEINQLLDLDFIADLLTKYGHESLDIVGFIPVAGEVADVINGFWYLISGDGTSATLCFASMLPVVGDIAVKTTKYTIVALKAGKTFKLTGEALQNLSKISKTLKVGNKIACEDCLNLFAKLLSEFPDKAADIEKIASKILNVDNLKAVLAKVDELPTQPNNLKASFFNDLAENTKFADDFLDKLATNEGLVDSWKVLSDYPLLRKNLGNLEVLSKVKGKFTYGGKAGQEALEEVFTGHKSVQKFIDNFQKYDDLLGDVDGLTVTGIKSSSEVRILNNGNQVGKFVDGNLQAKYSGFGGDVVCDANKTTTILGKWEDPSGGGTSEIINSKLSKSGQNHGGANVLSESIPDGWSDKQIWDNVNEPWLRDAAERGDIIRVVSDPTLPSNIYKPDGTLSFFGKEDELLTKPISQGGLGYTYNPMTFTYVK